MRYDFDNINVAYDFLSRTTFVTGEQFVYEKQDKISARRDGSDYIFTMLGSEDERVNGEEINDSYRIPLDFGKAMYPLSLRVSDEGKLLDIVNFDGLKEQWEKKAKELDEYYGYAPVVLTLHRQYEDVLKDDPFVKVLANNMMYRLLFWHESSIAEPVSVPHFPEPEREAFYLFREKQVKKDGGIHYETQETYDEGSGNMVGGEGKLDFTYAPDGLPQEIKLWVKLEEKDKGYFFHEVIMKRK